MNKGDIVKVKATVETLYGDRVSEPEPETIHSAGNTVNHKNLYRFETSFTGVVLGITRRATGVYFGCGPVAGLEYEPAGLGVDKYHPVWMVADLHGQQYHAPIACLESDLEVIQEVPCPPTF